MFKDRQIHWIVWVLLTVAILDVAALGWGFRAKILFAFSWVLKNWTWEWVFRGAEIVALAIGFCAAWGAYRHAQHLKEVTQSLSTRFIGAFPKHLDEITKRMNSATESIKILADCVDYGSFEPEAHAELIHAHLTALPKPVEIKMIIWGPAQPMSRANKYREPAHRETRVFRRAVRKLLRKWSRDVNFNAELPRLLSKVLKIAPPHTCTDIERIRRCLEKRRYRTAKADAFEALQLCLHQYTLERLRGCGTIIACNPDRTLDPELFFWIIDGKEALYALPTPGKDAPLFYTNDRNVLLALEANFEQKLARSPLVLDS